MKYLTYMTAELEVAHLGPPGLTIEEYDALPWAEPDWAPLITKLKERDGVKSVTVAQKDPQDTCDAGRTFTVTLLVNAKTYVGPDAWNEEREWATTVLKERMSSERALETMYSCEGDSLDDDLTEEIRQGQLLGPNFDVESTGFQKFTLAAAEGGDA